MSACESCSDLLGGRDLSEIAEVADHESFQLEEIRGIEFFLLGSGRIEQVRTPVTKMSVHFVLARAVDDLELGPHHIGIGILRVVCGDGDDVRGLLGHREAGRTFDRVGDDGGITRFDSEAVVPEPLEFCQRDITNLGACTPTNTNRPKSRDEGAGAFELFRWGCLESRCDLLSRPLSSYHAAPGISHIEAHRMLRRGRFRGSYG